MVRNEPRDILSAMERLRVPVVVLSVIGDTVVLPSKAQLEWMRMASRRIEVGRGHPVLRSLDLIDWFWWMFGFFFFFCCYCGSGVAFDSVLFGLFSYFIVWPGIILVVVVQPVSV